MTFLSQFFKQMIADFLKCISLNMTKIRRKNQTANCETTCTVSPGRYIDFFSNLQNGRPFYRMQHHPEDASLWLTDRVLFRLLLVEKQQQKPKHLFKNGGELLQSWDLHNARSRSVNVACKLNSTWYLPHNKQYISDFLLTLLVLFSSGKISKMHY